MGTFLSPGHSTLHLPLLRRWKVWWLWVGEKELLKSRFSSIELPAWWWDGAWASGTVLCGTASVSQEHCAPFPKGRAAQRNGVLLSWSTFPIYPFHSRPKLKTELGDPPRASSGHDPAPQKSSSCLPRRFGAPTQGNGVLPGCSQPCPQLLQRPLALGLVRLPLIDSLKPPSCIITEL